MNWGAMANLVTSISVIKKKYLGYSLLALNSDASGREVFREGCLSSVDAR
jgi:hypothetical protein